MELSKNYELGGMLFQGNGLSEPIAKNGNEKTVPVKLAIKGFLDVLRDATEVIHVIGKKQRMENRAQLYLKYLFKAKKDGVKPIPPATLLKLMPKNRAWTLDDLAEVERRQVLHVEHSSTTGYLKLATDIVKETLKEDPEDRLIFYRVVTLAAVQMEMQSKMRRIRKLRTLSFNVREAFLSRFCMEMVAADELVLHMMERLQRLLHDKNSTVEEVEEFASKYMKVKMLLSLRVEDIFIRLHAAGRKKSGKEEVNLDKCKSLWEHLNFLDLETHRLKKFASN